MRHTCLRRVVAAASLALTMGVNACDKARANQAQDTTAVRLATAEPSPNGIAFPAGAVGTQTDGEWTMPARDFASSRYSPLSDINVSNVGKLKVTMTMSTGTLQGHEGQPLVIGSTMYVVTPFPNNLFSIDLTKPGGVVNWTFSPGASDRAVGIACCDVVNRGAAYADGKIIYNTLDAHTIAVDAKTGKELWRTRVGDINIGETITMAPLIVKGKVLVGNAGGELGVRGHLTALDVTTGKQVWKAYSTGSDADVLIGADFKPFYPRDRGANLGVSTWTKDQWKLGGGTVWGWLSYDPNLNLIYYGTGNPGVWNADLRPGDNKWSITLFARDPDNGQAKWAYQFVKHDAWDYDEIMENVLVDMPFNGQQRKLLIHPGRTGFVYVFDRTNGELLKAETYQPVTWAKSVDLKTGETVEVPEKRTHDGVITRGICPSSTGAKDQQPSAFSPRTGLLYIPAHNVCMDYEGVEANYIAGTPYVGASVRMYAGPGDGRRGDLVAWDPVKGQPVCNIKEDLPLWSGILATAGDVVFYGTLDGWFKAIDARNCAPLWQFKTGSGIVGNPITYRGPDGKQYIAVYSGVGGWMGVIAFPSVSIDDPYTALGAAGAVPDIKQKTRMGGMLYVFGF